MKDVKEQAQLLWVFLKLLVLRVTVLVNKELINKIKRPIEKFNMGK